jgi:DNA-binding transcriptional ArsR family regulator
MSETDTDRVWRALADPTRRAILDALAIEPHTTGQVVARFPKLSRTGVMKHLDVLEAAGLLVIEREGRVRWNKLNPMPIQRIYDRWVSKHVQVMASALSRLKDHVEAAPRANQTPKGADR